MKLSNHFDSSEFLCPCCGKGTPSPKLIEMLEKLHDYMGAKAIIISSGVRCPDYSVKIGGYRNDGHVCSIAADLCVQKEDGSYYTSSDIAEAAERVGFEGIGIINDTYCHLDTRGYDSYVNNWWHGREDWGVDFPAGHTFERGTIFPSRIETKAKKNIKVIIDDKTIWEGEI